MVTTKVETRSLIHPDHYLTKISMAEKFTQKTAVKAHENGVASVGKGSLPVSEYIRLPISGLFSKFKRRVFPKLNAKSEY